MMMTVVMAGDRLGQVREVGELATLRCIRKVRPKLVEQARQSRMAVRLGSLSGPLQVGGDLLCDLLVLGWIRLLKLLQRVHQLGELRKLAAVRL